MEIVLITGMSGSGKTVALHALEDCGLYCVDNLPPELLTPLIELERKHNARHLAIAMDVRSGSSLPNLPRQLNLLRSQGVKVKVLYLEATTATLLRRFSETRRLHPLSRRLGPHPDQHRALMDAIAMERELLANLREEADVIDTSLIRPSQLQGYVKATVAAHAEQLTLVFQSFAFKRGAPVDADYVFDVRMLPNPHYEPELRLLTGRDQAVIDFLQEQSSVQAMLEHIANFFNHWLDILVKDHRSYVTVAIGCTGGQHRSVYLVEQLEQRFSKRWPTLKRHRELDAT